MCCIQMIIVTGGYDGSQDVASTEVMNFSGEKLQKSISPAKTKGVRWSGGKLGSFHPREVDLVEPTWPESFTWLEVETQDILLLEFLKIQLADITDRWYQVWMKTTNTCKKFFCGTP